MISVNGLGPCTLKLKEMCERGEVGEILTAEQLELLRASENEIDEILEG